MLTVGDEFPDFKLNAVVDRTQGREFREISKAELDGSWAVLFFWPMDFTFVCPTEIATFGQRHAEFVECGAKLFGASTDSHYVHLAWREHHPDLRDLPFPMLADLKHELTSALGILDKNEGVALRATFIVDPAGIIRHVAVNDLAVGRDVGETLRILAALQTGELTPCGWHKGDATLA